MTPEMREDILARAAGDPIAEAYFAAPVIKQATIDWLVKTNSVPPSALHDEGFALVAAKVVFHHVRFDIDAGGVAAILILARDATGDVADLVAWRPRDEQIATLLGRAAMLGEEQLFDPVGDLPVAVCRTPLEWLQADRRGVVILDADRAGRILIEAPGRLAVADTAQAKRLAGIMTRPCRLERIVMPKGRKAAA